MNFKEKSPMMDRMDNNQGAGSQPENKGISRRDVLKLGLAGLAAMSGIKIMKDRRDNSAEEEANIDYDKIFGKTKVDLEEALEANNNAEEEDKIDDSEIKDKLRASYAGILDLATLRELNERLESITDTSDQETLKNKIERLAENIEKMKNIILDEPNNTNDDIKT